MCAAGLLPGEAEATHLGTDSRLKKTPRKRKPESIPKFRISFPVPIVQIYFLAWSIWRAPGHLPWQAGSASRAFCFQPNGSSGASFKPPCQYVYKSSQQSFSQKAAPSLKEIFWEHGQSLRSNTGCDRVPQSISSKGSTSQKPVPCPARRALLRGLSLLVGRSRISRLN